MSQKISLNLYKIGCFLLIISMFTVGTLSSYTMSWKYTIALILVGAIVGNIKNLGKLVFTKITFAWSIVVVVCFLSSVHTKGSRDFIFYLLTGMIIISSRTIPYRQLYKCFWLLVAGAVLVAIGIFIQHFFPGVYDKAIFPMFQSEYRSAVLRQYYAHRMCTGFNSEASVSAQFMIVGMISLYCVYPNLAKRKRKYVWILGLVFFAGIILTGKRSSLLFTMASFLYTLLISTKKSERFTRILRILVVGTLIAIVAYFALPGIAARSSSRNTLVRLMESVQGGDVTNGRLEIWRNAITAFKESPILGKGWGWFGSVYGFGAHNIYIQLLCECGVVGAVIVIPVLFWLFFCSQNKMESSTRKNNKEQIALSKFCLFTQTYILLYGFTGNPIYNYSFFLWYAFSLCILNNSYQRNFSLYS